MKSHLILTAILLLLISLPYSLANPVVEPWYITGLELTIFLGPFLLIAAFVETSIVAFVLWKKEAKMGRLLWTVFVVNLFTIAMTTFLYFLLISDNDILFSYSVAEIIPVGIEIAFITYMVPRFKTYKKTFTRKMIFIALMFANIITFILGIGYGLMLNSF